MFHTIATFLPIAACLCQAMNIYLYSITRRKTLTIQTIALTSSIIYCLLTFLGSFMLGNGHAYSFWDICNIFGYLMLFPSFLLYIKLIMEPGNIVMHDWLTFTIPILLTISVCVVYGLMTPSERIYYMENYAQYPLRIDGLKDFYLVQKILHLIGRIILIIQFIHLIIKGKRTINSYKEKINEFYSDDAGRAIGYTSRFFHIIFSIIIAIVLFCMSDSEKQIYSCTAFDIICIICAIVINISCHYSLMQINITYEIYREKIKKNASQQTREIISISAPSNNAISLKNQITIVIERDQLYLKPNLKASELARALNTTQSQLQTIINTHFGTSFSGLINRYRINHAKNIMKEQPDTPIYVIAEMSGYATEMSFYNNFKLITGTTPTLWKRQKGL